MWRINEEEKSNKEGLSLQTGEGHSQSIPVLQTNLLEQRHLNRAASLEKQLDANFSLNHPVTDKNQQEPSKFSAVDFKIKRRPRNERIGLSNEKNHLDNVVNSARNIN